MKIYRISSEPKQMKKNKYNFHKLDQETKKDWFTVSSNCSYAWLDVKNEKIISNKILDSTFTNLVIYNNNKTPVAIYSSRRIVKRKILFLTFRVLESHFNGLFIADQYHHLLGEIRGFFLENVLNLENALTIPNVLRLGKYSKFMLYSWIVEPLTILRKTQI